jgi:hypothetical protein
MGHRCEAPKHHGDGVADAGAQPVDQPSDKKHSERVGALESENQISVINIIPTKLML